MVYDLPNVTFTGTLSQQCISSNTYTITGGSPAGGTYSGAGVTGDNFNASIAGIGPHIITYTYTDNRGCTNSATNTISVLSLPVVTWLLPSVPLSGICISASNYSLMGGIPTGGTYTGPGVSGGVFNPSIAGVGSHILNYTYTDVNGCSNSTTNSIEVYPLPIVGIAPLTPQCVNVINYPLTGGIPVGGIYSGPGVTASNFDASNAGIGTWTISYTYTDANACTNTASTTVQVKPLPNATITSVSLPPPPGSPACLTVPETGANYNWAQCSGTTLGINQNIQSPCTDPVNQADTYCYCVTVTKDGCDATDKFCFSMNCPPMSISSITASPNEVCSGQLVNLNVNVTGGLLSKSYSWASSNSSQAVVVSSNIQSPVSFPAAFVSTIYTYYVTVTDGCNLPQIDSIKITVNPNPIATITQTEPICDCSPLQLNCVATSGTPTYNYQWVPPTGTPALSPLTNPILDVPDACHADGFDGTYNITVTDSKSCVGTASFTPVIHKKPKIEFIEDQVICSGSATTAIPLISFDPVSTYYWSSDDPSAIPNASGPFGWSIPAYTISATPGTIRIITVTVTAEFSQGNLDCMGNDRIFRIFVIPEPPATISVADMPLCANPVAATTPVALPTTTDPLNKLTYYYEWVNLDAGNGMFSPDLVSGIGDIPPANTINTDCYPHEAKFIVYRHTKYEGINPPIDCDWAPPLSFKITINPTPSVDQVDDQQVCWNSPFQDILFTGSCLVTTYTINPKVAFTESIGINVPHVGDVLSFLGSNTSNLPLTNQFKVTPEAYGCVGTDKYFDLTVYPELTINISNIDDKVYCAGELTSQENFNSIVAGTDFKWTCSDPGIGCGSGGIGSISPFTTENNTGSCIIATIEVTPFQEFGGKICYGSPVIFTITVLPKIHIKQQLNISECVGTEICPDIFTLNQPLSDCPIGLNITYEWFSSEDVGIFWGLGDIECFTAYLPPPATSSLTATVIVIPHLLFEGRDCEGEPMIFTITVNPLPNVIQDPLTPNPPLHVCSGEQSTVKLISTPFIPGTEYLWSVSLGSCTIQGGQTFGIIAGSSTGVFLNNTFYNSGSSQTILYSITPSLNNCKGSIITVPIIINPLPVPGISGPTTVCTNENGTYSTESGMSGYIWTASPGNIPLPTNSSITSINWTTPPFSISLTYTDGNACEAANPTVLDIIQNAISPGTFATNQTVCSGGAPNPITESLPATSSGVLTYQWQSATAAGGPYININLATSATYAPPALTVNTWYRRQVISTLNGTPCSAISNVVAITLNHITASVIAADQTICNGGTPTPFTVTTAATGVGSLSYQWQQSATGAGGPFNSIGGATSSTYDPPVLLADHWYWCVVTSTFNGTTCADTSNTLYVRVNNVIAGSIGINSGIDQTICSGAIPSPIMEVTTSSGSGNLTYQWQQSINNGSTWVNILDSINKNYYSGSLTQETWYRRVIISVLNNDSCNAISNVIMVFMNNIEPGTVGSTQTICSGDTPTPLTSITAASGTGAISYQWQQSTDGGGNWSNISGAVYETHSPTSLLEETWYIRVATSVFNGLSCIGTSDTVKILINDVTVGNTYGNQTICAGDIPNQIGISGSAGTGTISYDWQKATASFGPWTPVGNDPTYPPPALSQTTYYQVIVSSVTAPPGSMTCQDTGKVLIEVNHIEGGELSPDQTICPGQMPGQITSRSDASGTGDISYQWQGSTDLGMSWENLSVPTPNFFPPAVSEEIWYRRIGKSFYNGISCEASSDTAKISFGTFVFIPNAFTPHDYNNINDVFLTKAYGVLNSFHMTVYSRWGDLVFETDDILKGWDGTYHGDRCPSGLYIYKLNYSAPYICDDKASTSKYETGTILLID
jgi:gliding motility-associated-like protein